MPQLRVWFKRFRKTAVWRITAETFNGWSSDKAPRLGAALAFYSILSIVPLLLLVLSVATYVWGGEAARGQIADQMNGILGTNAAEAIQSILAKSEENKHAGLLATLIGFITLLFSASGMFGELQDALNVIWKSKPAEGRPLPQIVRKKLFCFLMVLGSGFLLLLSVLVSTGVAAATKYVTDLLPEARVIMRLADFAISFGLVTFLFSLIFKIMPYTEIPWRSVWPGGILTALLFVLGKSLIGFYLGHFSVTSTYGAAGSLVALLVWIYYSAQILFLGAEFTYAYSTHYQLHDSSLR